MKKLLVSIPESTSDALIVQSDRERIEKVVEVCWRTDLNGNASESLFSDAIASAGAEIVVTGWGSPMLTPAVMEKNPQLRWALHLTGTMRRYVDRKCIAERGLLVTNWGDTPAASVAEAALMMMLMSARRAWYWQKVMHIEKAWRDSGGDCWTPQGLYDKNIGIYGFGRIARMLAVMLKPFRPKLLAYSPYDSDDVLAEYGAGRADSLEELFERSEIISIHAGLTDETRGSVNAPVLANLRDGGHLVNTARGAIINTDDLYAELKTGRIFAALDVFEEEPLPAEHPLRGLNNCLLFPHQGGPTVDYRYRCGRLAADQVERYVSGRPLLHVVTSEDYDRMT